MLDYIRSNAQTWGVKAAFGIIILVFVFWGVGNLRDSGAPGVAATVNGKPILLTELFQAKQLAEEAVRRTSPGIAGERLREMGIVRQALQGLIVESVLMQEAERLGLAVSPVQLRQAVERIPLFQDKQGKFDPEAYKRVLTTQGQSMGRFEESMRRSLLEENLRRDITAAAWVSPEEARAFFDYAQELREIEYVFFPASDYKPQPPADDEIRAWYESNRAQFAIPAKVDVEYVLVRPEDMVKPESIDADSVKAWYEKNMDRYAVPERVKARHILLRLEPGASEAEVAKARKSLEDIAAEARKGGDFAALAAKRSQDAGTAANGGDLGWIERGDTVPAFNDAAFALKEGELSAPVRTEFGLHLIRLDKREAARTRTPTEVEGEIRRTLAEQRGAEKIRESMDGLIEANILNKSLKDAAAALGLEAKRSGPKSAEELQSLLGIKEKDAQVLMSVAPGAPLDTALEAQGQGFAVVRVLASAPADVKPLAEVREEIVNALKERRAEAAALEAASAARKTVRDDALPPALAARAKTIANVGRSGPMPVFGEQPQLLQALFGVRPREWLPVAFPVRVDGKPGATLARVRGVVMPDDAQWRPLAEIVRVSLEGQRKDQMFQAFLGVLMDKAKVEIKNSKALLEMEKG